MISLGAEAFGSKTSNFVERHLLYAKESGANIHIVTLIPGKHNYEPVSFEGKLFVYPVSSGGYLSIIMKSIYMAFKLSRSIKFNVMYTQDPFGTAIVGLVTRLLFSIPIIIGNHSSFIDNRYWINERKYFFSLLNFISKKTLIKANACRVINHIERKKYNEILNINLNDIFVVNTPVLLSPFLPLASKEKISLLRKSLGIDDKAPVFIWVGRPVPVKRIPLLLEAFKMVIKKHPDARLLLIGNFSLEKEPLDSIQSSLEIDSKYVIKLCKGVPHTDLPLYYQMADLYVHSSSYEGFGKVLIEAAASGLPVLSTATAGAQDSVNDGKTGCLVPLENAKALSSKMIDFIENRIKWNVMGVEGRKWVQETYDSEQNIRRLIALWRKVAR